MDITQVAVVMLFGALVAAAGLALLFFRREQGENIIRLFGQEFRISTPALVVFLVGCFIFILPSVIQMQNQTVFSFHPWQGPGPDSSGPVKEGKKTNNQITTARLIVMGTTISGVLATNDDRDFFKFKTSQGLNTRVIVRKTSSGGFHANVTIYDNFESKVVDQTGMGEESVSFVFRSRPNSYYYAKIEPVYDSSGGPYELLIKEE
jgi:hypothetical protein